VGEEVRGICYKRNIFYKTFCLTCEEIVDERKGVDIEIEKTEEVESGGKKKRLEDTQTEFIDDKKEGTMKRDFKVKCVGESGRSGYEHGLEHKNMYKRLDDYSHLLKYYLIYQQDIQKEEMRFGMRVRNVFKTILERQVGEALAIDYEKKQRKSLMKSKSKYNRCTLPGISTRNPKEQIKELEEEKEEEDELKKEVKKLRLKMRKDLLNK